MAVSDTLEAAETRLVEARAALGEAVMGGDWHPERYYAARDGLVVAAIEVGRLRTLLENFPTLVEVQAEPTAPDTSPRP